MQHKLKELGAMLLILVFLGVVGYFCAGLHVRAEQDYSQTPCGDVQ